MADTLNFSLWFPSFHEEEMLPRTVSVMRQFLFSETREGITYLSVHPVAWSEPTVLEQRFNPGISPEEAADIASEFVHDDFAFVFEAFWDLWLPSDDEHGDSWVQRPVAVHPAIAVLIVAGEPEVPEGLEDEGEVVMHKFAGDVGGLLGRDSRIETLLKHGWFRPRHWMHRKIGDAFA